MDNEYEKAANCYECCSYANIFNKENQSSNTGLCFRVADCAGGAYSVRKEWKKCIFGNHDRKLSLEEIKTRDEKELKDHISFNQHLERASKIVESWPKWEQNILGVKSRSEYE